jgi:UDP-N-acetylglucosamine enolpyruvyl transferase
VDLLLESLQALGAEIDIENGYAKRARRRAALSAHATAFRKSPSAQPMSC